MNDYILSNENAVQTISYSENIYAAENVTEAAQEEETQTEPESQSTAVENTESSASVQTEDVISRNVITGKTFEKSQLSDYSFVHGSFYTVTSITELTSSILRPAEFIEKDLSIKKDSSQPQILIFHTHSQETFADSVEGDTSTSIVGVGDYLTELLTARGYNVIHDTEVYDYVDGKLDRSKAYTYAEEGIDRILSEYPGIEVVIDLHRDGVAETTRLVTEVDGKQMAKIMFFNGLSYSRVNGDIDYLYNPYRDDNLAMSLQMQLLGTAYYPGFLRNIYVNAYRYCLHKRARSMLIEAGAQTNTVQEVKNAMEPLADLLDKFLSGEKVY
jgi:stage II sporulation protein P